MVALATATIAVPYWLADADSVADDGIFGEALLVMAVIAIGAAAVVLLRAAPWFLAVVAMCVPAPVAVLGRVLLDTAEDPTSHNLWPLEVVLAVMISALAALAGTTVAGIVRWARA